MKLLNQIFTDKKRPCLFINLGGILKKLLEGSKMGQQYKAIKYNTLVDRKPITDIVNRLNIKIIVVETSRIKEFNESIINELISLRIKGVVIYEAEEFYEIINKRIPIVRLNEKEYLGDDIFSIRLRRRYRYMKRAFDLLCVLFLLPVAFPLVIIGAVLTKLTSQGEMFFRKYAWERMEHILQSEKYEQ